MTGIDQSQRITHARILWYLTGWEQDHTHSDTEESDRLGYNSSIMTTSTSKSKSEVKAVSAAVKLAPHCRRLHQRQTYRFVERPRHRGVACSLSLLLPSLARTEDQKVSSSIVDILMDDFHGSQKHVDDEVIKLRDAESLSISRRNLQSGMALTGRAYA